MVDDLAAEELLRSRDLLNTVLDYAPGFIIAIDESGYLKYINRVLPQFDKKDVVGSHWLKYMPPEQHDSLRVWFRACLETGASKTYETNVPGPNGEKLWFTSHMGPMSRGGRVVGVVLVAQDITELRRAELAATAAQRMAAVGTLATGIAHEINTPIQFVSDSLVFLREGLQDILTIVDRLQSLALLVTQASPPEAIRDALAAVGVAEAEADLPFLRESVPEAFDRCVDGLGRVSSIIKSIGEFAHPAQLEMLPVDLNRAIANTLTIARNEYMHLAELETELAELPLVVCHIDQINQVVLNLVVNAAHAIGDVVRSTGTKGHLGVRTRMEGEDVVISVSDTGTGIPEDVREHIFEPFFTTKDVGVGTGQGLALAWSFVTERHGGTLTYETVVGQGTTFFVRLHCAGHGTPAAGIS
ncbi:MAG: ATP-binding protein [Polyangiaceae bacterium]